MLLILASMVVGALLCYSRHWFGLTFASVSFFIFEFVGEWRSGSGFWTSLAMAYAVCFALQLSFLTVTFLSSFSDAPKHEMRITKMEAPSPNEDRSKQNDRRSATNDGQYVGEERRSTEDKI